MYRVDSQYSSKINKPQIKLASIVGDRLQQGSVEIIYDCQLVAYFMDSKQTDWAKDINTLPLHSLCL